MPEQMFVSAQNPGEAVSAVKALQKASQQGQRIYRITQANAAAALPEIHHSSLVMQEIRDALAAGKEVVTHTDAVGVPGWSGAGYILYDPDTGGGAFKIGGGMNGGWQFVQGLFAGMLLPSLLVYTLYSPILAAVLSLVVIGYIYLMVTNVGGCFNSGLALGVAVFLEVANFRGAGAAMALAFLWDEPLVNTAPIKKCIAEWQ